MTAPSHGHCPGMRRPRCGHLPRQRREPPRAGYSERLLRRRLLLPSFWCEQVTAPVALILQKPVMEINVSSHRSVESGAVAALPNLCCFNFRRLARDTCARGPVAVTACSILGINRVPQFISNPLLFWVLVIFVEKALIQNPFGWLNKTCNSPTSDNGSYLCDKT